MSDFNALKFVADNAGLNIFKALEKAYEQGKADANHPEIPDSCNAKPVEAIPVPWIVNFKNGIKEGALMEPREVIKFMLEAWKEEQEGE